MTGDEEFAREREARITRFASSESQFAHQTLEWFKEATRLDYSYNFDWLGRPIIQYPSDVVALQEVIFERRPELILETGVARGGSTVFLAHMLATLDLQDSVMAGKCGDVLLSPSRRVVSVDIDIRTHNREALDRHFLRPWMTLIEGSSTAEDVIQRLHREVADSHAVMVILDSNHTHDHVLAELEALGPLCTVGQFLIVMDTVIEILPDDLLKGRPWSKGNSPASAVEAFLRSQETMNFAVRDDIVAKLQISVAPGGFLERRM